MILIKILYIKIWWKILLFGKKNVAYIVNFIFLKVVSILYVVI
jgi:hypothetical protein